MFSFKCSVLSCVLLAGTAHAAENAPANFPTRPVRFITGFLPGGVSDTVARVMGERLGEQMGTRVVIDGRPGAGGVVSMEIAAAANPDGYTWYLGQPVITISPNFKRKLPIDPLKAFAPVSLIGISPTLLVVNPALPVNSVPDLIKLAKSRPEGIRVASSGAGTTNHFASELLRVRTGANFTSVPYKGSGATVVAAMAGEVECTFSPFVGALPHVKTGRLKAIAVTGAKRSPVLPNVPTIAETLPGYSVEAWYGLLVPAKTPPAIVNYLSEQTRKALEFPSVRERLVSQGVDVGSSTPAEFSRFIRDDAVLWAKVIRDAGIQLD